MDTNFFETSEQVKTSQWQMRLNKWQWRTLISWLAVLTGLTIILLVKEVIDVAKSSSNEFRISIDADKSINFRLATESLSTSSPASPTSNSNRYSTLRTLTLAPGFPNSTRSPESLKNATDLLWLAAEIDDWDLTKAGLELGGDPYSWRKSKPDNVGKSLLHFVAWYAGGAVAKLLVDAGANLESRNGDGMTPLHCAINSLNERVVESLLEAGADVEARDKDGQTPLHRAVILPAANNQIIKQRLSIIKTLVTHKAKLNSVNDAGRTPLREANYRGMVYYAAYLRLLGATQ